MTTETRTRNERWLSADELRKLAAAEPDAGPPPPPVHRTAEPASRAPLALGIAAALLAALLVVVVVL